MIFCSQSPLITLFCTETIRVQEVAWILFQVKIVFTKVKLPEFFLGGWQTHLKKKTYKTTVDGLEIRGSPSWDDAKKSGNLKGRGDFSLPSWTLPAFTFSVALPRTPQRKPLWWAWPLKDLWQRQRFRLDQGHPQVWVSLDTEMMKLMYTIYKPIHYTVTLKPTVGLQI